MIALGQHCLFKSTSKNENEIVALQKMQHLRISFEVSG